MKKLLDNIPLPNLLEQKALIIRLVILVTLVFAVSYSTSHLFLAYSQRQETLRQIDTMNNYLVKYREKAAKISAYPFRPVAQDKVDSTQSAIIYSLQNRELSMDGLKELMGRKEEHGRLFELSCSGAYPAILEYMNYLRSREALIAIKNVTMASRDGKIHTKLTYKIYTK